MGIINIKTQLELENLLPNLKHAHFYKDTVNVSSEINLSGFYIVFKGSTMNEKPGWFGISHLMEHLVCKSIDHLMDEFQTYDVQWNAYTSGTEVVFFMRGLDKYINKYKNNFINLILNYQVTDKHLQNEKKIVLEEYKDAFNSQSENHYLNLMRKRYGNYNAIGLRSDIENFNLEDCQEYLDKFYRKPTEIINVSKNSEFSGDFEFLECPKNEPFKVINNQNFHTITSDNSTVVPTNCIPLERINKYKGKSSIIDSSKVITEKFAYVSFTCSMLGSGLNSPLYKEIREKLNAVYYIRCYNDKLNDSSSVILFETQTSNKNVKKVQKGIKKVIENKEKYLTQERFDIIKESYKAKFEKAEILNYSNIGKYVESDEWLVEKIIDTITLQDVYDIMDNYLKWEDLYLSIDRTEF